MSHKLVECLIGPGASVFNACSSFRLVRAGLTPARCVATRDKSPPAKPECSNLVVFSEVMLSIASAYRNAGDP